MSMAWLGLPLWGSLLQGLVQTMAVVVPGVPGQDLAEVPLAEDQHVVQALAAQGPHEPLRECVRGDRADVLITRVLLTAKTQSNGRHNSYRVKKTR